MLFYYGTTKELAENIKMNGFSWKSRLPYRNTLNFTNNYLEALLYAGDDGEVLKVYIKNVRMLKLNKDYSIDNKTHISELKCIIMYSKLNSNKNCLVNIHNNEFLFFNKFEYMIYL